MEKNLLFMVVEDNPNIRRVLRKTCRKTYKDLAQEEEFLDYELLPTLEAGNGLIALKQLSEANELGRVPDLILSDWRMPEMDGLEFVKELKSKENYSRIPVIMTTAEHQEEQIIAAKKAGVHDYIRKPFQPALLEEKIKKVIKTGFLYPILVVEDEEELRRIVRKNLKKLQEEIIEEIEDLKLSDRSFKHFKLLEAWNGKNALEILLKLEKEEGLKPGLILSDWRMPEMDGYTFVQHLKKIPLYQNIPIVMTTAEKDRESVLAAIKAGITDYIAKPFKNRYFREKVRKVILENYFPGMKFD
ncbi:response regulator [Candidatus Riflebacteria bacterium]